MNEATHTCSSCRLLKPAAEFTPSVVARPGRRSGGYCRSCRKARRDLKREYDRARNSQPAYRERHRRNWLRRAYGVSPAEYEAMLARQAGACACCGTTAPGGRGRWHVDHDHRTGAVRGILCHRCNVGIGHFGDSVVGLHRAIHYLGKPDTAGMGAGLLC